MVDVFLSYASQDLQRARRVEGALTAAGYDVFWDQTTPPGADWDSWIREKLSAARMVVVLWSKASVASANVRHEAILARDAGKLIPILIEPLSPSEFPMGLYLVQGLKLDQWDADSRGRQLQQLVAEVGARIAKPPVMASTPKRARRWTDVLLGAVLVTGVAVTLFFSLAPSSRDQECRALQVPDTSQDPGAVTTIRYSRLLDTCLEFVAARAANEFFIYDISNNFIRDESYVSQIDGSLVDVTSKRMVFQCDSRGAACALEARVHARNGLVWAAPYNEWLDNCEGGPSSAIQTPTRPYTSDQCQALFGKARERYMGR